MSLMDVFVKIGADTSGLESGISKTKGLAGGLGSAVGAGMKVVGAAIGTATAAVGAFAASSVEVGKTFDSSMSQVAATMGVTVDEIGELRDFAQEMGRTTSFSATQAADALNYMALAGYDATQSMEMLPNVLNLAAAGDMELARASDMVTDAASALGFVLEDGSVDIERTTELVDMMAKASSKSNTSVAQLGDAILTVGGTAKVLAGGTTELNTSLGILADNGIKGAEGGTKLRNVILSLSAPTDKAAQMLEGLGVATVDAEGNLKPLEDIMGDLGQSLDGLGTAERAEIINTIFNKQDIAAVNALLDTSSDRWDELSAAIDDSKGAAEAMANTQLNNLEGDITLFKSALEGVQILISDALTPSLREFVQFGTEGLTKIGDAFKEGGLEGAMEAFGQLLSDGLNMIIEKVPEFINAGAKLLSALGQGIMDNLPTLIEAATQIILMLVQYTIEALPALIEAAAQIILQLATGIAEALPTLIPTIVQVILTIVEYLIENIDLLIDAAIQLITGLALGLIEALPILIEKVPEIILKLTNALIDAAPKVMLASLELVKKMAQALITYWPQLISKIPELMEGLKKAFINYVGKMVDVGKQIVEGVKKGIAEAWDSLVGWFSEQINGLVNGVKGILGIKSPSKVFADQVGKWIPAGIAVGIKDGIPALDEAMAQMNTKLISDSPVLENLTAPSSSITSISDAVYNLLATYLPVIADKDTVDVVLEGDADRLFRVMQSQSRRNKQITGQESFA